MAAREFSLEVEFKSINYLGNLSGQMLHRIYGVATAPLESYFTGCLEIHEHFGTYDHGVCRRTFWNDNPSLDVANLANHFDQLSVTVGVRDLLEGFRPLGSTEGLQPLENCLMFCPDAVQPEFLERFGGCVKLGEIPLPLIWRVYDQKLRAVIELTRSKVEQLKNEVIQGGFEVVRDLANEDRTKWGWIEAHAGSFGAGMKWAAPAISPDFPLKAFDVYACPRYSRLSIIEGWLYAIEHDHAQAPFPRRSDIAPAAQDAAQALHAQGEA
ncbi:MAG TPA: hypothetical protein VG821_04130 [Rhizomicrobium sp.]|nr:hypothetical protein [Rhizomicrobium sp.]